MSYKHLSALENAIKTMRHTRKFITIREQMHPDGVELYDEALCDLIEMWQEMYSDSLPTGEMYETEMGKCS